MTDSPEPTPVPPDGFDSLPSVAELTAQFERSVASETRPFFALAGAPITSARLAEHSCWQEGEGGDPARAFVLLVIRYGDGERWAKVGTWFGQHPAMDPTDALRESMIHGDMARGLGLDAAEPGDGEAYANQDAMLARIRAAQAQAEPVVATSLVVDGESLAAFTASVGDHRRTYFSLPVGGVVFLHTCRWAGPTELQRSFEYASILG